VYRPFPQESSPACTAHGRHEVGHYGVALGLVQLANLGSEGGVGDMGKTEALRYASEGRSNEHAADRLFFSANQYGTQSAGYCLPSPQIQFAFGSGRQRTRDGDS